MSILALVQLLLPVLLNLLGSSGVISPSLGNLIGQLAAAIPTLISSLLSGGGVTNEILAVLQAIQSEVNALKQNTNVLTQNEANEINALDAGITDALNAYKASLVTTDPSNLTPLPESL